MKMTGEEMKEKMELRIKDTEFTELMQTELHVSDVIRCDPIEYVKSNKIRGNVEDLFRFCVNEFIDKTIKVSSICICKSFKNQLRREPIRLPINCI